MNERSSREWLRATKATLVALVLVAAPGMSGCAVQTVKTHASGEVGQLDSRLSRGHSTKADVLLFLGEPDGAGDALLPTTEAHSEIWYYETHASGLSGATMKILLVYFRGDFFDGYMWFENQSNIDLK